MSSSKNSGLACQQAGFYNNTYRSLIDVVPEHIFQPLIFYCISGAILVALFNPYLNNIYCGDQHKLLASILIKINYFGQLHTNARWRHQANNFKSIQNDSKITFSTAYTRSSEIKVTKEYTLDQTTYFDI